MDNNNTSTAGKCPVMHGSRTTVMGRGKSNQEWWPNQLNLSILHTQIQSSG